MTRQSKPTRRLIVLGSTGSIGVNTLAVAEHLNRIGHPKYEVVGLAAGSNADLLRQQAERFSVRNIAIGNPTQGKTADSSVRTFTGPDAALELIQSVALPGDLVVGAMVGSAGVPATLAAIERGCDIALANKETLVAAGELVMPRVREQGVTLLPIDSEHSAIFQCLATHQGLAASTDVKRVVLTASGGPFRTWSKQRIANATVEEALNHPTWNMGPKVTIDSASLMNKTLEIIEAHWLFALSADQIEVIIHPQSLVHSFVEFVDGSVVSQLGPPDMRTPIQYALTWPQRCDGISRAMDWAGLRAMEFEQVDLDRFPAPRLAYEVIETGGTAGAILNGANEAAVAAFLQREIPFNRITELTREALLTIPASPVHTMNDVLAADRTAREFVQDSIAACATRTH